MKKHFSANSIFILTLCLLIACLCGSYLTALFVPDASVTLWIVFGTMFGGCLIAELVGIVLLRIFHDARLQPLRALQDRTQGYLDYVPATPPKPISDPDLQEMDRFIYELARRGDLTAVSLRQNKEKFSCILESSRDGILILTPEGKITNINRAAKSFFRREYNAGYYLSNYTTSQALLDGVAEVQETGREVQFELDDEGAILRIQITPMALRNPVKEIRENWIAIFIRDITTLYRTDAMRTEFFANVSHELKTPLTSLIGYGDLLSSGSVTDDETRKQYEHRMLEEAHNMASLIDDILQISKLEDKSRPTETEPVELMSVAREVADSLSLPAEKKQVSFFFYGDGATVTANPGHIHQLLKNLLENAVLYNKDGGRVEVTVLEQGDKAFLRVSDTGIGISKEHQGRIFERFYRVDKGRSRSLGGTGLGLSIVKHTVLNMGGTIELRSTEQVGTTIEILLPKQPS